MNLISIFRRLFLPLVVLLLAATAGAQSAYDEIKADIDKAGGVYFMYPFDTPSATPAPKGYEPFYISHYGPPRRRYILSNDQYDNVAEVLRRARADGKLTARGIDACDRFLAIYPHLKGRAGDLTPKGQMQHRRLAGRMYAAYPEIFRRHPRIEAYSTVVPRCIMSMGGLLRRVEGGRSVVGNLHGDEQREHVLPQSALDGQSGGHGGGFPLQERRRPLAAGVAPFLRGAYRR